MRLEEYTADALCRAMGLERFVDPEWAKEERVTLRVVLTPSFHPELCITLSSNRDSAHASIVALDEQFWSSVANSVVKSRRAEALLTPSAVEEVSILANQALEQFVSSARYVTIDGMGMEVCMVSQSSTRQLKVRVSTYPAADQFITKLLQLAWSTCESPRVQNALAQAAQYVDLKFPLQEVEAEAPRTRIGILGTPEEQSNLLDSLRHRSKLSPQRPLEK